MARLAGIPYRKSDSKPRSVEVRRGAQANPAGIVDAGALATEGQFQRVSTDEVGCPLPGGPRHLREQLDGQRQARMDRMVARWQAEDGSS